MERGTGVRQSVIEVSTAPSYLLEVERDASKDPVVHMQTSEQQVRVKDDVSGEDESTCSSQDHIHRSRVGNEQAHERRKLSGAIEISRQLELSLGNVRLTKKTRRAPNRYGAMPSKSYLL